MIFLTSYNIEAQDIWGRGESLIKINCEFVTNDTVEAHRFGEHLKQGAEQALNRALKVSDYHIVFCPTCMKQTKLFETRKVLRFGEGHDVLGVCSDCNYVFPCEFD